MEEDLLEVEWEVKVCNSGESCWCRVIVPKEPLGDDLYVVGVCQKDLIVEDYVTVSKVDLKNRVYHWTATSKILEGATLQSGYVFDEAIKIN